MRSLLFSMMNLQRQAWCGNRMRLAKQPSRGHERCFRATEPVCMGRRSAKIATRKGAQDAAKAKLYGKLGKQIIKAVKAGGPDAVANSQLADLLRQARDANVPKDIIERNIKKASEASQADFDEVLYEAYGPGGTGFVIECLTDNVNRSASEVRAAVVKGGGKVADPGSVLFNFRRQGRLLLRGPGLDEDTVFVAATDAGADDFAPVAGEDGEPPAFNVFTAVEDWAAVRNALAAAGLPLVQEGSGLVYTPLVQAEVDDEAFAHNEAMFERILGCDDVDAVYSTCDGLQ